MALGIVSCVLILSGCFAHHAEVTDGPAGTTSVTAGPIATDAPAISQSQVMSMKLIPGPSPYSIDVLRETGKSDVVIASRPPTATLAPNLATMVSGWAVDAGSRRPAATVFVTFDGKIVASCPISISRPDVATALGSPDYTRSGFSCMLPARSLTRGRHALGLRIAAADGRGYYAASSPTELIVQ